MSKYIDVDVFIKSFRKAFPRLKAQVDPDLTPKAYAYLRGGEAIIEDLTKFPAADVVEVVRCRECKYSFYDEIFGNFWCNSHSGCRKVKDEGFCDLGERKEGVDND